MAAHNSRQVWRQALPGNALIARASIGIALLYDSAAVVACQQELAERAADALLGSFIKLAARQDS